MRATAKIGVNVKEDGNATNLVETQLRMQSDGAIYPLNSTFRLALQTEKKCWEL